jgi:hypothetical protein
MTEILKVKLQDKYYSYGEALEDLKQQGVKHLGWLNAGINIPQGDYTRVYKDWGGCSVLMCNLETRIAYSVDMGD